MGCLCKRVANQKKRKNPFISINSDNEWGSKKLKMGNNGTDCGEIGQMGSEEILLFLNLSVECFSIKAQYFSRFRLISSDFNQDLLDILLL